MIIKNITLRNFKSFGNNRQTVSFNTTSGDLILASGNNGAGKTSFQQSLDFSLFGVVRGKNGRRVPQSILPNRINKNLETEIEFINNLSDTIKIQRSLEPNLAKIFINNIDESKKFKNYKKEERDKIIGFDFETYKSFISMSVSDFANFIDLNPEEKRTIINRLFNLKELDDYLLLTNGMIKQENEKKIKYETIIETNNQTIDTLNQNIISIKKTDEIDTETEIKNLEDEKNSKREPYITLKKDIEKYNFKLIELDKNREDLENQKDIILNDIFEAKVELKNIEEKLNVYKSGTCPVCSTNLTDETHLHDLSHIELSHNNYIEKLENMENEKNNIILKLAQISNQKNSIYKQKTDANIKFNNITYELKLIVQKISKLNEKRNDTISVDELIKNISELKLKNIEYKNKIDELNLNIKIYEELKEIFSHKGVRKNIIKHIIKPINVYLKDILDELKSPYDVKIDDEFNVNIYERLTNLIHPETLSMGESKKINIGIALSYLKLILKFRKLNVLFLDEVFSSMEPDSVEYTLKILKSFTKEFNLNIIILDPKVYFTDISNIGFNYFDRVIKFHKKLTFSTIEE